MIWITAGIVLMLLATVASLAFFFADGRRQVLAAATCSGVAVVLVLIASRLVDHGMSS